MTSEQLREWAKSAAKFLHEEMPKDAVVIFFVGDGEGECTSALMGKSPEVVEILVKNMLAQNVLYLTFKAAIETVEIFKKIDPDGKVESTLVDLGPRKDGQS